MSTCRTSPAKLGRTNSVLPKSAPHRVRSQTHALAKFARSPPHSAKFRSTQLWCFRAGSPERRAPPEQPPAHSSRGGFSSERPQVPSKCRTHRNGTTKLEIEEDSQHRKQASGAFQHRARLRSPMANLESHAHTLYLQRSRSHRLLKTSAFAHLRTCGKVNRRPTSRNGSHSPPCSLAFPRYIAPMAPVAVEFRKEAEPRWHMHASSAQDFA